MVEITCDSCERVRPQPEDLGGEPEWILGTDLEMESRLGLQHSVRFYDRWEDRRVLELGAVHFCCEACKDKYIRKSRAA